MTTIQLISHTEQMEAVRADFERTWDGHIMPVLMGLSKAARKRLSQQELAIARHAAWIAFVAGSGVRKSAGT